MLFSYRPLLQGPHQGQMPLVMFPCLPLGDGRKSKYRTSTAFQMQWLIVSHHTTSHWPVWSRARLSGRLHKHRPPGLHKLMAARKRDTPPPAPGMLQLDAWMNRWLGGWVDGWIAGRQRTIWEGKWSPVQIYIVAPLPAFNLKMKNLNQIQQILSNSWNGSFERETFRIPQSIMHTNLELGTRNWHTLPTWIFFTLKFEKYTLVART